MSFYGIIIIFMFKCYFLWLFKSTNYGLNLNPHQISSIKVLLYCKFLWFCGLILKNTKLECWLKNFTAKLYFRNLNAWTITLISLFVRLPIPWSFFYQTINFISFKLLKIIKFVFWLQLQIKMHYYKNLEILGENNYKTSKLWWILIHNLEL